MAPADIVKNGIGKNSSGPLGPHPGIVKVSQQFIPEQDIQDLLAKHQVELSREVRNRIDGVELIENIRSELQLPVSTFDTAVSFYHRFRLSHTTAEYSYPEAAVACLLAACKAEDTLKKSRDILCAYHNIKNPAHRTTADDKIFDAQHRMIIGLERKVLMTIQFDFRGRYPQKILAKLVSQLIEVDENPRAREADAFYETAFRMSLDMYKTFVPLKHTSYTMGLALMELTATLTGVGMDRLINVDLNKYHTNRAWVLECLLDLVDLYTEHRKFTQVGPKYNADTFLAIKVNLNREREESHLPRHFYASTYSDKFRSWTVDPSTTTHTQGPTDTTRFIFDVEEAHRERDVVKKYLEDEYDEIEVEIEETIPTPTEPSSDRRPPDLPRGPRGPRGGGRGHGGGFGRGFDPGRGGRGRGGRGDWGRRRGGPGGW